MRSRTLAVLAFDDVSPFHLSVPWVVFGEDRRDMGVPRHELLVCGVERRRIRTSAGFHIEATHGLADLPRAATVIVPAWRNPDERPPQALLDAVRAAHARGARVVGLCLGAFVLAEAGLLDGRGATTHWAWAERFAARFPQVRVDADSIYVDEGDVVTSAGNAAGLDCCLHLLREEVGAEIANRVARRLVVPPHRSGGQAQFIEQPMPVDAGGDRLSRTLEWATRHLAEPMSVDDLAARAAMSRRTFTRRFRDATGTSVSRWLGDQRLAHARRLLETTGHSIERVAGMAGFGTAMTLRLQFARHLGTSPAAYRKAFREAGAP